MLGPGPLPIVSLHLVFLLRNGDLDAARAAHDTYVVDLTRVDWYAPINQAAPPRPPWGWATPRWRPRPTTCWSRTPARP